LREGLGTPNAFPDSFFANKESFEATLDPGMLKDKFSSNYYGYTFVVII